MANEEVVATSQLSKSSDKCKNVEAVGQPSPLVGADACALAALKAFFDEGKGTSHLANETKTAVEASNKEPEVASVSLDK